MKSSPLELYWVYPLVLWRVAHVATPTISPAWEIFTSRGLQAAPDSELYYNQVPLIINSGYASAETLLREEPLHRKRSPPFSGEAND